MEAIQQRQLIKDDREFKYGLAYTYIIGAAFWNFVGAGVFGGGTLNAPLVNYYEHGTFLNHAHTALFGAFGLLGIGLIYFCLRYIAADRHPFGERIGLWAFWLYNAGLVLWILLNFFLNWLRNSTRSTSMVSPMHAARSFTTRPSSGSGCASRATSSSRSVRC